MAKNSLQYEGTIVEFGITDTSLDDLLNPLPVGASLKTLEKRAQYRNRKGRSARRRLLVAGHFFERAKQYINARYGLSL